jgi:cardiolipin synthase
VAALTDLFDGLFARLTNQRTVLGKFLDPLADTFLLVTAFIIFSIYDWIPKWLTITVISRDIIIVTGWFLLYFTTGRSNVDPSVLGKATIWVQSMLIAYVLSYINRLVPNLPPVFLFFTAGITILSGLHYLYRGLKVSHAD